MKKTKMFSALVFLAGFSFLLSCSKESDIINRGFVADQNKKDNAAVNVKIDQPATVTVLASGINYPRGLKFGTDGELYVATAGLGGTNSTQGQCTQVVPPIGPYKGGSTAKIIKIDPNGAVTTVAENLPSAVDALGDFEGVADVAFTGNTLYALLVAGCSHGNPGTPTSVIKVNPDGTCSVVADLSTFIQNNPVAAPDEGDFEPDGDPYSMVSVRGDLYVVEANSGQLLRVTTGGSISRVLDFSAHFGHIVPTSVGYDGNFFVGNLSTFPLVTGNSSIYKITPAGVVKTWATGFTGILGVTFDRQHRMYVLETSASGFPSPNTGRIVRVNNDNSREVVVDNLTFPTGMTFGPDGALYISDTGFGPPTGRILKVTF
ncbi:MAG: ScyD/ScyE family protein [Bacteroidales bacterium]